MFSKIKISEKNLFKIISFLFFVFIVLLLLFFYKNKSQKNLEITILDVGQGSAAYIKTPEGIDILIDAGKENEVLKSLKKEITFFDKKINYLIASHQDLDHIGGFLEIFKRYDFDIFLWNGFKREVYFFEEIFSFLEKNEKQNLEVYAGEKIVFPSGVLIEFFFPFSELENLETNSSSVVLKISYGENSVLFTGDLPQKIEKYLAEKLEEKIKSDVLIVSHHGSKTSSNEFFLEEVSPDFSVISAGENNPYGHPHFEVLEKLEKTGSEILETSKEGNIKFILTGQEIYLD